MKEQGYFPAPLQYYPPILNPSMKNGVIVINAGSSSIKIKVFETPNLEALVYGQVSGIETQAVKLWVKSSSDNLTLKEETLTSELTRDEVLSYFLKVIFALIPTIKITLVGHRVVHGGTKYTHPVEVGDELIEYLKTIIPLAPLHLPHNIKPMEVFKKDMPNIKQVACFDTGFHSSNASYTRYYAIPRSLTEEGLIRYGFHGLSYEYITEKVKELDYNLYKGKMIVCHLGAGASMAAIVNGESIATTMGFTPLEGIVMGTRCGDIDAGVLLYLMKYKNYNCDQIQKILYNESGILGLSEESSDFYTIQNSSNPKSIEAWKVFVFSVIKKIGSLITAINGADGIIFTGGVGENSTKLRLEAIKSLSFMGVKLDEEKNAKNQLIISSSESKVKVMVVPTNEELIIAKHTVKHLS